MRKLTITFDGFWYLSILFLLSTRFLVAQDTINKDMSIVDELSLRKSHELSLGAPFGNHMVLQQNNLIAVWGKGRSGETVSVTGLWGEAESAIVNDYGDWQLKLSTPKASFDPQTVTVSSGMDVIVLENVLIGEVWLCSGQSNMHFRLKFDDDGSREISNKKDMTLRLLNLPTVTSTQPEINIDANWVVADSASLSDFSAVAYYFGKDLLSNLKDIPIGLVNASYGSSTIEAFMSLEALQSKPYLNDHRLHYTTETPSKMPSAVFNAMIHPLLPFTIRGIIWYQGESNVVRASQYEESLKTLINYRRAEFKNNHLPFYIVQIPGYAYSKSQQESELDQSAAVLREAQRRATEKTPNTSLIVTSDVGDVSDLHPKNKKPIGKRLAATALNQVYGQTRTPYKGPELIEYTVDQNKIILNFEHAQNGFKQQESELNWFLIAGGDKVFHQGNAFADGCAVSVSSPFVETPVAIRFAWHNEAVSNFTNSEGLPASPFRTDNWTNVTYKSGITSWSSLPDISRIPFDLTPPDLEDAVPSAGKKVKQTLIEYEGTEVYHTLFLPNNWTPKKRYPIIVEYAGNGPYLNKYGDTSTGKPEDVYLGYGLSGGEDFIIIGMPFISEDGQSNALYWWGDVEASVQYTLDAVQHTIDHYGGDQRNVIATGFSRGAIACNFIGLNNEKIASIWRGFIINSHYDGIRTNWGYANDDAASALDRLKRLGNKPQIIIQEGNGSSKVEQYLKSTGVKGDFTFLTIPYRNHDARWTLQKIAERQKAKDWLYNLTRKKMRR